MDVADWLRRIGFGQYEVAFRDNGIGQAVLPHDPALDRPTAACCLAQQQSDE